MSSFQEMNKTLAIFILYGAENGLLLIKYLTNWSLDMYKEEYRWIQNVKEYQ